METRRLARAGIQVLHGCRQLVPGGVRLSPATSATHVISCYQVKLGTLMRLPVLSGRKAWMTSSPYGLYIRGCTRATMVGTEGSKAARRSRSPKPCLSSDCSLQLDCMKPESLVKAYQLRRLEYVPGPCTHRPSHHGS